MSYNVFCNMRTRKPPPLKDEKTSEPAPRTDAGRVAGGAAADGKNEPENGPKITSWDVLLFAAHMHALQEYMQLLQ